MITLFHAAFLTLAYACSTMGMYFLLSPILKPLWVALRVESEHRKRLLRMVKLTAESKYSHWIRSMNDYIEMMLRTIRSNYRPIHLLQFWAVFLFLGILVGTFMVQWSQSFPYGIWTGMMASATYLFLHMLRLRKIRIQAGYELVNAIGILNIRYKTERYNMERALMETAKEYQSEVIRKHFFNIVKARKSGTPEDVEEALEEFQFAINTKFSKHLSAMIHKSLDSKENIESTLMALDQNIVRNVNTIKAESDIQAELMQFKWFHLIAFPITIFAMIKWLGWDGWITYQLHSALGQFLFLFSVMSIAIVFFLANWFRDTPNDY